MINASYRIQFHRNFGFRDAQKIVPYLARLGISHLYASPLLKAKPGSIHGYDVEDPSRLNPELGSESDFRNLVNELKTERMELILDIVPNHMSLSPGNLWLQDVLQHGISSRYAQALAIDWDASRNPESPCLYLPILGAPLIEVLQKQELKVERLQDQFIIRYYDWHLPLGPRSYRFLLAGLEARFPEATILQNLLQQIPLTTDSRGRDMRLDLTAELHRKLGLAHASSTPFWHALNDRAHSYSSNPEAMKELLNAQLYCLSYWREGALQRNYRRFFDVDKLIGLRIDNDLAFRETHACIFQMLAEGQVQGLRVDHIDGMARPRSYLERLRREASVALGKSCPIWVEKILNATETLPADWPVEGTTGYDFLGMNNNLFIDWSRFGNLRFLQRKQLNSDRSFESVEKEAKAQVLEECFGLELSRLSRRLAVLIPGISLATDEEVVRETLAEVSIELPVYRTYIEDSAPSIDEQKTLMETLHRAGKELERRLDAQKLEKSVAVLNGLENIFFHPSDPASFEWVRLWQQFTGPLMAKGHEDTALYRHTELLSLNEVGGQPGRKKFSIDELHRFLHNRALRTPRNMNASSTHDTKRSEDVRARLNLLSEIPEEWESEISEWSRLNASQKTEDPDFAVPGADFELFIYQTLVGAWPLEEEFSTNFRERMKDYFVKAAKEAKIHTNWRDPSVDFEESLKAFVERILDPERSAPFLERFIGFHRRMAFSGALNSLSQLTVKLMSPGFPDIYQGNEIWDYSLVDPDNRRAVDYSIRERLLQSSRNVSFSELLRRWPSGAVKQRLIQSLLRLRRYHPELFMRGSFHPLKVSGSKAEHVFAFLRCDGDHCAIVAVPRLLAREARPDAFAFFLRASHWWDGNFLELPGLNRKSWRHALTDVLIHQDSASLPLSTLFATFPIAVLA